MGTLTTVTTGIVERLPGFVRFPVAWFIWYTFLYPAGVE